MPRINALAALPAATPSACGSCASATTQLPAMIAQPMNFQPVAFIGSSSYPLQEEVCLRAKSWRAPLDRFQGIIDAHVAGDRSEGVGCDAGTACAVVAWRKRFHEHEGRRLSDSEPVECLRVDQPLDLLLPDQLLHVRGGVTNRGVLESAQDHDRSRARCLIDQESQRLLGHAQRDEDVKDRLIGGGTLVLFERLAILFVLPRET